MAPKLGYLLPTREHIMQGRPEAAPLLALAERAEALGYASVWVGDSLLARPRHEPLTLLAGVAGRVKRVEIGTAVLLPALRNPVLLAHQVATLDQVSEGRLILGVGFASDRPNIRAEFAAAGVPFEKRLGRMMEGLRLCKALWTGEAVDWDGRWHVDRRRAGSDAVSAGRPAAVDRRQPARKPGARGKVVRRLVPECAGPRGVCRALGGDTRGRATAGRDPAALTGAMYLTVSLDEDAARADARLNAFLEGYYGQPAAVLRRRQVCYAGPAAGVADWLAGYAQAGASHLVLRFAGEHERHLEALAKVRTALG